MHELPRLIHKRMMTDIAFGKALAAAASFSLAVAEEQAQGRGHHPDTLHDELQRDAVERAH
jgi:hypothetical protein